MPILAVNVIKVLFAVALYLFLFYVARAMRGHIAGPPLETAATPSPSSSVRQPADPSPPALPTLHLTLPDGSRQSHVLRQPVVVGRGDAADVRIEDEYASERHASFAAASGGVFVEDLGSTNGTTLDGSPITGRVAVPSGSTVLVGKTQVKVR